MKQETKTASAKTILEMIPFDLFRFRVLIEREGAIFAATCLETGNVATADDRETVIEIMIEVLQDEWTFNVERENLKNLLTPAKPSTWAGWQSALGPAELRDGIEWKSAQEV